MFVLYLSAMHYRLDTLAGHAAEAWFLRFRQRTLAPPPALLVMCQRVSAFSVSPVPHW